MPSTACRQTGSCLATARPGRAVFPRRSGSSGQPAGQVEQAGELRDRRIVEDLAYRRRAACRPPLLLNQGLSCPARATPARCDGLNAKVECRRHHLSPGASVCPTARTATEAIGTAILSLEAGEPVCWCRYEFHEGWALQLKV